MNDTSVLVIGAGPTGLTMAIELARAHIPFRLIDKAKQGAKYSQALIVQARTLEQFERYGIAEKAVQRGRKIATGSVFSEGRKIASLELDRIPGKYPYALVLPQNETEQLLTEHLQELGGQIERGCELISFDNRDNGITAELQHENGTEQVSARWMAGCDGAHSTVRKSLDVPFPGNTVGFSFLLGDLEMTGPDVPGDELRIYLHRGELVFIGRLSDKIYRVIAAPGKEPRPGETEHQPELPDFQEAIDRCGGDGITVVSSIWTSPFRINQRKAESYRVRSVFLAGDACHIHSPFGGQGMNTGIQDAANLGWKIAAVEHGTASELLNTYDEERGAVGRALLKNTSKGLAAASSSNVLTETVRDAAAFAASHVPYLQNELAGFVSETALNYRNSSLVVEHDHGGSLRAGDRLPVWELGFRNFPSSSGSLVLAINLPDLNELQERLPRATIVPVNSQGDARVEHFLGAGQKIVVVRPDGYIGFRGSIKNREELDNYASKTGLV